MTVQMVAIGVALVLVGCAFQSDVISSTENTINIKAGNYTNPGPQASEHCAKHGKKAVLENVTPMKSVYNLYTFRCQ